ncbi:MAG: hypothetical protein QXJ75_06485 [Candidatus Bathyarchaeia archaeon]
MGYKVYVQNVCTDKIRKILWVEEADVLITQHDRAVKIRTDELNGVIRIIAEEITGPMAY